MSNTRSDYTDEQLRAGVAMLAELRKLGDALSDETLCGAIYDAMVAPLPVWECAARRSVGANDPQDCNWPLCGCDDHANKVIETLNESGFYVVPGELTSEMLAAAIKAWGTMTYQTATAVMMNTLYKAMVERSQKPASDTHARMCGRTRAPCILNCGYGPCQDTQR